MKYVCCKKCKLPEITHEVNKKNLVGICRSCGSTDNKMDVIHKAGKQLHKDIQTYYKANPEFGSKQSSAAQPIVGDTAEESKKPQRRSKKGQAAADAAAEESKTAQQLNKERAEQIIQIGGEINKLDCVDLSLTDAAIGKLLRPRCAHPFVMILLFCHYR